MFATAIDKANYSLSLFFNPKRCCGVVVLLFEMLLLLPFLFFGGREPFLCSLAEKHVREFGANVSLIKGITVSHLFLKPQIDYLRVIRYLCSK